MMVRWRNEKGVFRINRSKIWRVRVHILALDDYVGQALVIKGPL